MVLENIEDAKKFVDYAEELIEILEYDDGEIYETIVKVYPEICDFESFKKFYFQFLSDCPNSRVVEGYVNDEKAKSLWDSIIIEDKDEQQIKDLSKIYIGKIFAYEVILIRDFFKIENVGL